MNTIATFGAIALAGSALFFTTAPVEAHPVEQAAQSLQLEVTPATAQGFTWGKTAAAGGVGAVAGAAGGAVSG
ncbi:MAG: hypothetical protein K0V04_04120, partial [Deltaproteobacteria bacterium]|nr:hypothetical protein [Deltaproteobacteria bacterium]